MRFDPSLILVLACAALILAAPGLAEVPENMNVQGRLTDAVGDPVPAGLKSFTFKIWDAEIGGAEVWPGGPGELQSVSTNSNGHWTAQVGKLLGLTEAVFQDTSRWLEVTVDDGVNPPETLTRIKLNTNPYSYHSASSLQADLANDANLLNGMSSASFVLKSGDVMTGNLGWIDRGLRLNADLLASEFQTYDSTGALSAVMGGVTGESYLLLFGSDNLKFNLNGGDWGQQSMYDIDGDLTISLSANSTNGGHLLLNQEDGTFGMFLRGGSSSNGSTLWMYSAEGSSVIRLDADLPGDSSVMLPDDAISSSEIFDEPGIAQGRSATVTPTSGIMVDLATVTITIPTSGYIYVHGHCSALIKSTTSSLYAEAQIDESVGGAGSSGYTARAGWGMTPNASNQYHDLSPTRIYFKTAGTYTFRLEGAKLGSGSVTYSSNTVTAMFFPTAYGGVSTIASSADVDEFETAVAISIGKTPSGEQGAKTEQFYEVDLRDLELKVAREEAEAEKAKHKLLEAQLQMGLPSRRK